MWKLVVRVPGAEARVVDLAAGARLGRSADCELALAHPSVSRLHARVEVRGPAWFLVDADSRNGLRVGGRREAEVELRAGLHVLIGEVELAFDELPPTPPKPASSAAPALDEHLDFEVDIDALVAKSAVGEGEALELEDPGEIRLQAPAAARPAPGPQPAPPSVLDRQALGRTRRERTGLLGADLAQLPGWQKALVALFVLAALGGSAWLAFWAVGLLRGE